MYPSLGGLWTWCNLSWGRRLCVDYKCNGECYVVMCLARLVKCWENPTGGKSWFFTPQLGQRGFPRKNIVFT